MKQAYLTLYVRMYTYLFPGMGNSLKKFYGLLQLVRKDKSSRLFRKNALHQTSQWQSNEIITTRATYM